MVALIRTWNFDHNYAIVGATVLAQYQDMMFRWKRLFGLAGWTITRSCDSVAAGAAGDGVDRLTTSANIIVAAAGTAHSWIVFQSPAGVSRIWVLLDFSDATPTPPDSFALRVSGVGDFATGGTILAAPTVTGSSTAMATTPLLSTATVINRTFHGWYDDQGSIFITAITNGQQSPYGCLAIAKLANGEPAITQPWACYYAAQVANPGGGFIATNTGIYNTIWRCFGPSGIVNDTGVANSTAASLTSWVNGLSNANVRLADFPIDYTINSGVNGGYVGRLVDIRGCAALTASGQSQSPQDPDPVVRKAVGGLWLPVPTATALQF